VAASAPPPKRPVNVWAYTIGGLGLATAIAGGAVVLVGNSDLSTRNETPQIEVQKRSDLLNSGQSKQQIGTGLLIGGGAAVVVGLVLQLTGVGAPAVAPEHAADVASGLPGYAFRF
jgi:hypothetical protein